LTCLNDSRNRRSVAPDGVKTVTSRQFFYGRPPPASRCASSHGLLWRLRPAADRARSRAPSG
jgi:hypothetical protein